jgi:hypothetical protein
MTVNNLVALHIDYSKDNIAIEGYFRTTHAFGKLLLYTHNKENGQVTGKLSK